MDLGQEVSRVLLSFLLVWPLSLLSLLNWHTEGLPELSLLGLPRIKAVNTTFEFMHKPLISALVSWKVEAGSV